MKLISRCIAILAACWFFTPSLRILRWILPALMLIWITSSVGGCYYKKYVSFHPFGKHPYNNSHSVSKAVVKYVNTTSYIDRIKYVDRIKIINTVKYVTIHSIDSETNLTPKIVTNTVFKTAISPIVNNKNQRVVYYEGNLILCNVEKDRDKLILKHDFGVCVIPITSVDLCLKNRDILESIPYRK